MKYIRKNNTSVICFFLFITSFVFRVYRIQDAPIYTDEITWMVRAKETFLAVRTFNFSHIIRYFQSDNAWWNDKNDTQAISLPLVSITGPFISYLGNTSILNRNIFPDYVAGRIPLTFINSFTTVLVFLIAIHFVDMKTGVIGAFLFALDPINIANDRLIMNDGLLTLFILFSFYSFFYIKNQKLSIVYTAFGIGFAFLTKPVGLLPTIFLLLYIFLCKEKKDMFVKVFCIFVLILIEIHVFWPQAWFDPFRSIFEYLTRQVLLIQQPPEIYFLGQVGKDTPFYYYLFQVVFRLPWYMFVGLIFFVFYTVSSLVKNGHSIFSRYNREFVITLFAIVYFFVISFSDKKSGIRYLLPIWPYLYLAFSMGIYKFISRKKQLSTTIFVATIMCGLYTAMVFNPNYDYYFNNLFGSEAVASKYISTNLCYGAKESSEYVQKCFPSINQITYLGCSKTVVPYYYSGTIRDDISDNTLLVVEEYYTQTNYLSNDILEKIAMVDPIVVSKNGVTLSRIYDIKNAFVNECQLISW